MVSVQRSLQALQSYELGINPLRAILSIGYVLLVVVNGLAGGGHFSNGKTNSSLSAKYSTPLTPPGVAFSIWGIIFTLQGIVVVMVLLPVRFTHGPTMLAMAQAVGPWWFLGWLCQDVWQFVFLADAGTGAMWVCFLLLLTALTSFWAASERLLRLVRQRADVCITPVSPEHLHAVPGEDPSAFGAASEPILRHRMLGLAVLASSLNAGWLSLATCLGLLVGARASGAAFDSLVWPSLVLGVFAAAAGILRLVYRWDFGYNAALIWAFAMIASQPRASPVGSLAFVAFVLLAALVIVCVVKMHKTIKAAAREAEGAVTRPSTGGVGGGGEHEAPGGTIKLWQHHAQYSPPVMSPSALGSDPQHHVYVEAPGVEAPAGSAAAAAHGYMAPAAGLVTHESHAKNHGSVHAQGMHAGEGFTDMLLLNSPRSGPAGHKQ